MKRKKSKVRKSGQRSTSAANSCGTCQWGWDNGEPALIWNCTGNECFCPINGGLPDDDVRDCKVPPLANPSSRSSNDDELYLIFDERKVVISSDDESATSSSFLLPVGDSGFGCRVVWHHNPNMTFDFEVTPREGQPLPNAQVDVFFPRVGDTMRLMFTDDTNLRTFRRDHWSVSFCLISEAVIF